MSRNITHYKYIDALRGWAILGVIIVHSSQNFELPSILSRLSAAGARGVQLFFVVSALTLLARGINATTDFALSIYADFFALLQCSG